uniref:Ig-like domain-containing protein n=1 Tax=Mola mola TaxID=94237 RepID=A0A3Q3X8Z6_MOLML
IFLHSGRASTCLLLVRGRAVLHSLCQVSPVRSSSNLTTIVPSIGGAIKKPLRDLIVADSQTAVLECEVANPSSEGKWLKNGQSIDFNENTLSEVNGAIRRLVIVITKGTDIGEYAYQVATSKTTAILKVEGRSRF